MKFIKFVLGCVIIYFVVGFIKDQRQKYRLAHPEIVKAEEEAAAKAEAEAEIKAKAKAEAEALAEKKKEEELVKEKAKQPERKKFIEDMFRQGLIKSSPLNNNSYIHYVVTPKFKLLDYSDKQQFALVIWSYHAVENKSKETMVFFDDSISGKKLGNYSQFGFEW